MQSAAQLSPCDLVKCLVLLAAYAAAGVEMARELTTEPMSAE